MSSMGDYKIYNETGSIMSLRVRYSCDHDSRQRLKLECKRLLEPNSDYHHAEFEVLTEQPEKMPSKGFSVSQYWHDTYCSTQIKL